MVLLRNRAALRDPTGRFEHEGLGVFEHHRGREVDAHRFGVAAIPIRRSAMSIVLIGNSGHNSVDIG